MRDALARNVSRHRAGQFVWRGSVSESAGGGEHHAVIRPIERFGDDRRLDAAARDGY